MDEPSERLDELFEELKSMENIQDEHFATILNQPTDDITLIEIDAYLMSDSRTLIMQKMCIEPDDVTNPVDLRSECNKGVNVKEGQLDGMMKNLSLDEMAEDSSQYGGIRIHELPPKLRLKQKGKRMAGIVKSENKQNLFE